jgi:hypothetical protein
MATQGCGTYGAYQRHYKRGEKPCAACRKAHTAYVALYRARSGRTRNAQVPYEVLGALLTAAPSELEEWAEERLGSSVVTRAIEASERTADAGGWG